MYSQPIPFNKTRPREGYYITITNIDNRKDRLYTQTYDQCTELLDWLYSCFINKTTEGTVNIGDSRYSIYNQITALVFVEYFSNISTYYTATLTFINESNEVANLVSLYNELSEEGKTAFTFQLEKSVMNESITDLQTEVVMNYNQPLEKKLDYSAALAWKTLKK